jgi:general transcription factor 3C polypeptide 5 (transcription factor C subunit 1)
MKSALAAVAYSFKGGPWR